MMNIHSASFRNPNTTVILAPSSYHGYDVDTSSCEDIVEYIENRHGISVPANFSKDLRRAHYKYHSSSFYMPTKVVDQVVRACEMWKEYIDPEYFNKLVCNELLQMALIHTSVLSAKKRDWRPVGLVKEPPSEFETIVNFNGSIQVRGI